MATHIAIPGEDASQAQSISAGVERHSVGRSIFALALKSTGRATLIGGQRPGADHFGGSQPINPHFSVWMPVGRTYDIKTGKDWEGEGIAPDIAVDPTQALIVAPEGSGSAMIRPWRSVGRSSRRALLLLSIP